MEKTYKVKIKRVVVYEEVVEVEATDRAAALQAATLAVECGAAQSEECFSKQNVSYVVLDAQ